MVEVIEIPQRGLIKQDDFPGGDWRLESHRMRYVTARGEELALGQIVSVRVGRVNMERQQVDFVLSGE